MSEENIGGEEGIIEERRKKLQLLRDKNKAYVNDFVKKHYAKSLHKDNDSFSKDELEKKNITVPCRLTPGDPNSTSPPTVPSPTSIGTCTRRRPRRRAT